MRNVPIMRAFSGVLTVVLAVWLGSAVEGAIHWRNPGNDSGPSSTAVTLSQSDIERDLTTLVAGGDQAAAVHHVVVQFKEPLRPDQRVVLEKAGLKPLCYLGDNGFFAALVTRGLDTRAISSDGMLSSVQAVQRQWKLHPLLAGGDAPDWSIIPPDVAQVETGAKERSSLAGIWIAVYVVFYPDVILSPDAVGLCQRHGAKVRSLVNSINVLVVELPIANLFALADEDAVQWIEPPLPRMGEVNDNARVMVGADVVQAAPYGLDGSGVNVLVYDGGTIWAGHPDFGGRVAVHDASGVSSHSTHVAGTIGGSGSLSKGLYRGMAPGVTFQSYGFQDDGSGIFLYSNPGDIETDYREAIETYGAEISNNSIGSNVAKNGFPCEIEGDYCVTSMLIDAIVHGSLGSPMRIIWANGNERSNGRCGRYYRTTGPPAAAKNQIAVGAVNSNDDSMTYFSSWGPCDDGRLRPDICAPGCQSNGDYGLTSTVAYGQYGVSCGTSMASPVVTGVCALLLQDWKRLYPAEALPANAMLKTILIQTAMDLGVIGPDYQSGFGSVRVHDAVDLLRSGSFRQGILMHGENKAYLVQVPPGTLSLKATLAWDDPPGTVNAVPALVNDLDLVAISPSGDRIHYPWTLNPDAPELPAVRTQPDRLNNIEQVVVDLPAAGLWIVRVYGHAVPMGPQAFSLAVTPDLVGCASKGTIVLGSEKYGCESIARITVNDCDLNIHPQMADTVVVNVTSATDSIGEAVMLTEVGEDTGTFAGSLGLSASPAPGMLQVRDGDAITAIYHDMNNGLGQAVDAQASATIDCVIPVISNIVMRDIKALRAEIGCETNEPTLARLRFGPACDDLSRAAIDTAFGTSHTFVLDGLLPAQSYYFVIEAEDAAGNLARDDQGGVCHLVTTLDAPDYYTQQFLIDNNDLDYRSILFTPDGSIDYYSACTEEITELPVDPSGGIWLKNPTEVTLDGGRQVSFYGTAYDTIWVNTEGSITFGKWDDTYGDSLSRHFAIPRISGVLTWIHPVEDGMISWKSLADRIVVSWEHVVDASSGKPSTFQIEMYLDGRIRISWLEVNATGPTSGLSRGEGMPADYVESRLNAYPPCVAGRLLVRPRATLTSRGVEGGPFTPGCRTYTIENISQPSVEVPWSATAMMSWLTVTPANGLLAAGGSQTVEVCVNDEARNLPASTIEYVGHIQMTDIPSDRAELIEAHLAVQFTMPPVAHDILAKTTMGTSVQVALVGTDDGLPSVPGQLTYTIVSGPAHGQLNSDDGNRTVTYSPAPDFTGVDQFEYKVNDGGNPPIGGDSNIARVTVRVLAAPGIPVNPDPPDGAVQVPVSKAFLSADAIDASRLRVAIVAAAYPTSAADPNFTDPRDKMMATGRFHDVAIVDAGKVTPSLVDLNAYDGVLVWSNDQFENPFVLGDNLADYVDAGGGVVVAVFANVNVRSYSSLLGRFLADNYFCIDYPGDTFPPLLDMPRLVLDTVFQPFHPTMSRVSSFDGGGRSFRVRSSYLSPGASFVANWSDGAPLIAVREINGTPRVDLGMYPPSSDVFADQWRAETDGGFILANALAHVSAKSGCTTLYDLYVDTANPPTALVCKDNPDPRCPVPQALGYGTTYYWQIVAHNLAGSVPGPVWSFTTPATGSMSVADTMPPENDLAMDYGTVAMGTSRAERLTLCNSHTSQDLFLDSMAIVPRFDLFEDYSDGQAQNWQPSEPANWTIVNGTCRAVRQEGSGMLQSTYMGGTWQDGTFQVSLYRTGTPNAAAGLAFRASEDFSWAASKGSAYIISISATGMFYVGRMINGSFGFLNEWEYSKFLKIMTGINDITVNAVGPDLNVYLNGKLAWAGRDTSVPGAGRLALLGYTDLSGPQVAEHYYDNVRVGLPLPLAPPDQIQTSWLRSVVAAGGTELVAPEWRLDSTDAEKVPWLMANAAEFPLPDACAAFQLSGMPSLPATLSPGDCLDLDVAFKPTWLGTQACDLVIAGNDGSSPAQRVRFSGIGGPGLLQVSPAEDLAAYGPEGGPFEPSCMDYELSNSGSVAVHWTATLSVSWVSATPDSGTLEPGQKQIVSFCISAAAATLPAGEYEATLTVTDVDAQLVHTRNTKLIICPVPAVPIKPDPADQTTDIPSGTLLAWNVGVPVAQNCFTLGSAKNSYFGSNMVLANVCMVSTNQLLHEIQMKLNIGDRTDLYYLVAESSRREGPFTPVFQRKVTTDGKGDAYYSSGTFHFKLTAGRFYAIGTAWGDVSISYALDYEMAPLAWKLGTIEGFVGDRLVPPAITSLADFFPGALAPMKLCLDKAGCVTYDVYLSGNFSPMNLICSDLISPICTPPEPLFPNGIYQWKVIARNECSSRESSIFYFMTAPCNLDPPMIDRTAGHHPVSRKSHGKSGVFDVDLLAPQPGQAMTVESRRGGPTLLVVTFSRPVQGIGGLDPGDITLTGPGAAEAIVTAVSLEGRTLFIGLDGVVDGRLVVSFPGIADATDPSCPVQDTLCFAVLEGDVNGDLAINTLDLLETRKQVNRPVNNDSFLADVIPDGKINVLDLLAIRMRMNQTVSGSCP